MSGADLPLHRKRIGVPFSLLTGDSDELPVFESAEGEKLYYNRTLSAWAVGVEGGVVRFFVGSTSVHPADERGTWFAATAWGDFRPHGNLYVSCLDDDGEEIGKNNGLRRIGELA